MQRQGSVEQYIAATRLANSLRSLRATASPLCVRLRASLDNPTALITLAREVAGHEQAPHEQLQRVGLSAEQVEVFLQLGRMQPAVGDVKISIFQDWRTLCGPTRQVEATDVAMTLEPPRGRALN